jgi:predicted phage terminase large subunit-like protein
MYHLTQAEYDAAIAALPTMSPKDQESFLQDLEVLAKEKDIQAARENFLIFCHRVYPGFLEGAHHRFMEPILQRVLIGSETRVTVSMPPRFGKSETIAYLFVAWYLGHNPTHHIIMVTHTAALSEGYGRKIRDLIDSPVYHEIFPEAMVAKDKSAAGNWLTTVGGKYFAIGIGANVAGHGAHLLVADDLVSENAVMANPDTAFEAAWKYCMVGPLQRLMPNGKIVMIGCMTAETGVLMADGTEKELQHIKVGDVIATYDAGKITTSHVTNWIKHRPDYVYKIITTSGIIVRANKRHPFLVDKNGVRSWVRLRDLKVGDCLVKAVQPKGVCDQSMPKECVVPATKTKHGLKEKLDLLWELRSGQKQKRKQTTSYQSDIGENGKVLPAPPKGVAAPSQQKGCAAVVTAKSLGVQVNTGSLLSKSVKAILNTGTAFLRKLIKPCLPHKEGTVQYVHKLQPKKIQELDKNQNCTLITAMIQKELGDSCVMTATSQLGAEKHQKYLKPLPDTYEASPDEIVEIVEDGFEAVFDMEVERTENFIANGVVSHNTRWGKKDPIGRALQWAEDNPDSPQWLEVRFPAILPSGKSLWPEQWPVEQLYAKKASMQAQFWNAQYMQTPTSEEGALIKREWWKIWDKDEPPDVEFVIQAWDTAHEAHNSADFSACVTMGIWTTEDDGAQAILLNAIKGRWEFPELKKKVLEQWKDWDPESLIVEKKAAGAPLIQELRRMDIVVNEVTPSRGSVSTPNNKVARINAIADIFSAGKIWAPDKRWAHEVIDEVAEFPNGANDDFCDCVQMCVTRYRTGGFLRAPTDYERDDESPRRRKAYY